MQENYPYFHPLYAGQMLKPPHPVARAAYTLATWINPNNHALDGGAPARKMEIEAVRELAADVRLGDAISAPDQRRDVRESGSAVDRRPAAPGKTIVASEQAHYTHRRISGVLQLPFDAVAADARGRMDLDALEARLELGDVGTVVVTLGTTAAGRGRSAARNSRFARAIWLSHSRRCGIWRLFQAGVNT